MSPAEVKAYAEGRAQAGVGVQAASDVCSAARTEHACSARPPATNIAQNAQITNAARIATITAKLGLGQ